MQVCNMQVILCLSLSLSLWSLRQDLTWIVRLQYHFWIIPGQLTSTNPKLFLQALNTNTLGLHFCPTIQHFFVFWMPQSRTACWHIFVMSLWHFFNIWNHRSLLRKRYYNSTLSALNHLKHLILLPSTKSDRAFFIFQIGNCLNCSHYVLQTWENWLRTWTRIIACFQSTRLSCVTSALCASDLWHSCIASIRIHWHDPSIFFHFATHFTFDFTNRLITHFSFSQHHSFLINYS